MIRTARLHLRELTSDDAAFVQQLLNEPSFIRNIGDRGVRTLPQAVDYITAGPRASYERFGFGLWCVELDGAAIGICGLLQRDALPDPDIGFAFLPAYWSQGYAFEAASAVLTFARETLALPRVLAIVSPGNAASLRLLARLGFLQERLIRMPPDEREVNLLLLTF